MSTTYVLSPEGGLPGRGGASQVQLAARPHELKGLLVAVHDNAKPGATDLLYAIGAGVAATGARTRSWSKAHAARPSPHVAQMAATCDAALLALGD